MCNLMTTYVFEKYVSALKFYSSNIYSLQMQNEVEMFTPLSFCPLFFNNIVWMRLMMGLKMANICSAQDGIKTKRKISVHFSRALTWLLVNSGLCNVLLICRRG